MTNGTAAGNDRRLEKIATSIGWAAAHRVMTVCGLPLALAALGWLVLRVEGMDAAFEKRDGAIASIAQRSDLMDADHERRIDALELWRTSQERRR